jgi:hypothetical protein
VVNSQKKFCDYCFEEIDLEKEKPYYWYPKKPRGILSIWRLHKRCWNKKRENSFYASKER